MSGFGIQFLICNIFIALFVILLTAAKRLFRGKITEQAQYLMDFSLLALLLVPFLPIRTFGIPDLFAELGAHAGTLSSGTAQGASASGSTAASVGGSWIRDFTVSVDSRTSLAAGMLLLSVWLLGAAVMGVLAFRARLRLYRIECSALLLENPITCRIFRECCIQFGLRREPPVYTTPYLKTPVMTGLFHPRVLLPLHVVHDCDENTLRCILLHELNHYVRKDAAGNLLMNLTGVVYWFNPLVWYALRQMHSDRETACDAGVLEILDSRDRTGYGHTLISFAEKLTLFPFTSGMSASARQLKKRIRNIASYRSASSAVRIRGVAACVLTAFLLASFLPFLPSFAETETLYHFDTEGKAVEHVDLSSYFGEYEGSFVLYDAGADSWMIYNEDTAGTRVSPDSTYKIYDALLGLEKGIITPEDSGMTWDGTEYPIDAWNSDQDLDSAMKNSVNWYFQSIDHQAGNSEVAGFYHEIGYGNEDISGGIDSYWGESTLKISPIEQTELLAKLYYNEFGFSQENIDTVKDSLVLSSGTDRILSGKTGTGMVNGQNVNGWFVGYVEVSENVYFFAANIQNEDNASGSAASDIALSILGSFGIWQ